MEYIPQKGIVFPAGFLKTLLQSFEVLLEASRDV